MFKNKKKSKKEEYDRIEPQIGEEVNEIEDEEIPTVVSVPDNRKSNTSDNNNYSDQDIELQEQEIRRQLKEIEDRKKYAQEVIEKNKTVKESETEQLTEERVRSILLNHESRITTIEAFLYRLKNI